MKKLHFAFTFSLFLILLSCKKYDANGNEIKEFEELNKANFLLGAWKKEDSLGILKEIWKTYDDSTYSAESYYIINKKDTIHREIIELMQDREHLIYKTTKKGENQNEPIPYQMTENKDSLIVFENPKIAYPNKISYKLNADNSILTTVTGKQKGKPIKENYVLKPSIEK